MADFNVLGDVTEVLHWRQLKFSWFLLALGLFTNIVQYANLYYSTIGRIHGHTNYIYFHDTQLADVVQQQT